MFLKRYLLLLLAIFLSSAYLMAYQPKLLEERPSKQQKRGSAKDVRGEISFINKTGQIIYLSPLRIKTRGYQFNFTPREKRVLPKQKFSMKFRGRFLNSGKFQVLIKIPLKKAQGSTAYHLTALYYKVLGRQGRPQSYLVSNYEKLFLKDGSFKEPGMGNVFKGEKQNKRYPQAKPIRFPRLEKFPKRGDRSSLYKIPTNSSVKKRPHLPNPGDIPGDILRPRNFFDQPSKFFDDQENFERESFEHESFTPNASQINARGTFSWLGTDNFYHPAFAWRVRAWTRRNSSSSWTKRAEGWVEWDGKWNLRFNRPSGHRVKFQYIAFNRFFKPQRNNGDTYRWVGPERLQISSNHNEGAWSANTSSGNVRGLGEMYLEGAKLWSKLYWTGQINPLRASSIRVIFPNLTFDCGSGTGNPWSCANTGGNIWLIPVHALARGVMAHELSHQINYEFWNNARPPNSGGSHTLTGCFTKGLALLEGFADFMESWLYDNRLAATPNSSGINLETVPNNVCQQLSRNETYVAATFWDLYDKRFDGDDNLWFIHAGAVPGLYLRSGKKNSMQNFRLTYRNAANAEHRSIIDNIFKQNKNYLPLTH